ncbi:MAG: hypothetical protein ACI8SR_002001 [Oceanicoccus sp.]|jgi:hypothetical protein
MAINQVYEKWASDLPTSEKVFYTMSAASGQIPIIGGTIQNGTEAAHEGIKNDGGAMFSEMYKHANTSPDVNY